MGLKTSHYFHGVYHKTQWGLHGVFNGVFFPKIKSHSVGTCKIKYLKTISKCFIFFINLFRIQHPSFGTKLWFRQYVWKGVHNAGNVHSEVVHPIV